MTYDKRFFIKTINKEEENVLNKIIEEYKEHMKTYKQTFIIRIIGYFLFDFEITSQSIRVIVFENVFRDNP